MEISREVTINCCHRISSFGESVSLGMRAMSYSVQFGLLLLILLLLIECFSVEV